MSILFHNHTVVIIVNYNFSEAVCRKHQGSVKWNMKLDMDENVPDTIYPFTVADTDLELMPKIKVIPLEGSYLQWLDFNELELNGEALAAFLIKDCHCYFNTGSIFGKEGIGF